MRRTYLRAEATYDLHFQIYEMEAFGLVEARITVSQWDATNFHWGADRTDERLPVNWWFI